MKNKNDPTKPETKAKQKANAELRCKVFLGKLFKLEYSLKHYKITSYTTPLGYFHDMEMLVVAQDVKEAIKTLKRIHDDGKPESIKATYLGGCVKWPNE